MTPVIKSLLLYLMILGLVAFGAVAMSVSNFYIYVSYLIIILVVLYSGESLKWGKSPLSGLLLGSVLIGAVFLAEIIAGWVKVEGFDFNPAVLFQFLVLQVLVSAGEELSFRGYILKNLIDETGIKKGIIFSSIMFSAIHIPSIVYYKLDVSREIIALAVVGLIGVLLAILYLAYGLMSTIGFHFAWNFLQYNVFALSLSQPGLMDSRIVRTNYLTGGSYGPEAGIIGFVVVFFALFIFIKKHSNLVNTPERGEL
jgi:membrane protease YdiL (CAAX protease family)